MLSQIFALKDAERAARTFLSAVVVVDSDVVANAGVQKSVLMLIEVSLVGVVILRAIDEVWRWLGLLLDWKPGFVPILTFFPIFTCENTEAMILIIKTNDIYVFRLYIMNI